MRRLIISELRKVWGNTTVCVLVLAIVLLNAFFLWFSASSGANLSPAAYKGLSIALAGKTENEKQQFIERYTAEVAGVYAIETVLSAEAYGRSGYTDTLRGQNQDSFDSYWITYQEGFTPRFTGEVATEHMFMQEITREYAAVSGYPAMLENILNSSGTLSQISIFATENNDSFEEKNISQTAADFASMQGTRIQYTPQKGLFTATSFIYTDLLLIFALLVFAFSIVREEIDNGLIALLRSTPRGRLETALAKIFALAFSLFVLVLVLYLVNIGYCGSLYGLGSLGRSIQSVPFLMRSTLRINVWQYLLLYLLCKWAVMFLAGIWVFIATFFAKSSLSGWLASIALLGLSLLVTMLVSPISRLNVLRYGNLVSIMQTNDLLGKYQNLYWFGSPVSKFIIEGSTAAMLFALFLTIFLYGYTRHYLKTSSYRVSFLAKLPRHTRYFSTVTGFELYKSLITLGGAIVIILLMMFQIYQGTVWRNSIGADEIYYRKHMRQLAGPYTSAQQVYINGLYETFEPIIETERLVNTGQITQEQASAHLMQYQNLLLDMDAITDIVEQNGTYVFENPGAHFVYDTPYQYLFDLASKHDTSEAVLAAIACILLFSGYMAYENATGVSKLIRVTPRGHTITAKSKTCICMALAFLVALLSLSGRYVGVIKGYGAGGLLAPAFSLHYYNHLPKTIPIIMVCLFQLATRFIACWAVSAGSAAISSRFSGTIVPTILALCAFALPLLLPYFGLGFAAYFSISPLFSSAAMLQGIDSMILCLAFTLLWAILASLITLRLRIHT